MFVDRLDAKQQGALLALSAQLIEADANIAEQETQMLIALRSQMTQGITPSHVSISDLPALFPSNAARAALLLELLGLAHADAKYHVSEKDFIHSIAASLDTPAPTLADMESWVYRQFALVREAEQFMEG